jgi:hypothetical protein
MFFFFSGVNTCAHPLWCEPAAGKSLGLRPVCGKIQKKNSSELWPIKIRQLFARLLPYAMVVNAADRWADAFEGLGADSGGGANFGMRVLRL